MKSYSVILLLHLLMHVIIKPSNVFSLPVHYNDTTVSVPAGGNTWCMQCEETGNMISNKGIQNWTQQETTFETYVRVNNAGTLKVGINAKTDKESILRLAIGGRNKDLTIKGTLFKVYEAGTFEIKDTGYIKITVSGKQKKGAYFADISTFELSGTAINAATAFVKNNEGNFFYWGRRGPSVHLNYPFADTIKAEWFYNEITVPEKQDVIGSYYMANGFGEGYFGIQVNSDSERRVLFSVWSPFSTDDPKSIPQDMRITLLKKGEGVQTGEFGNEGSGGQSFLRYNWKAGVTYKFLLHGLPDGNGNTVFTAYFFAPEKAEWMLIASFKRPKTNTYLKRFHSFLENFIPEQGDKTRKVLFSNQWICDDNGNWTELANAVFTYDNTAAKKYRMDYAGGVEEDKFYLKNCGFFNRYTVYKSLFQRKITSNAPDINFNKLP
ncbi:MAG: DUF3472 domain-containing protein [Chitinophagaceae bacterium]|nr:DUF3472 domain-containing protein [Chitinophagaceae bacterium]